MDIIEELLTRGVANIIPGKEELRKLLKSGKKLNIYLGIDPTATRIHVGHAVPLRKIQAFAELGHNVTFLIGDFTALIGDTSDKDTERPVLTSKDIEQNFQTYKKQASKVLDFSKIHVHHNSEWLGKLDFKKVVELAQQFDFGEFAGRELIAKRLKEKKHVGLHEALYPLMQGYDSYFMDTDIQIGGTDQTFNMQAGRTLQKKWRNKESFVLAMEFLEGTDGRKMSKSWGNAIWLEDAPEEMYAKVMAIRDELIPQYFTLATNVSMEKVGEATTRLKKGENPRDIKKELANELVTELHGNKAAQQAEERFQKTVINKEEDWSSARVYITTYPIISGATVSNALTLSGTVSSGSEAKQLIQQGGIQINGQTAMDPKASFDKYIKNNEVLVKRGKRNLVKIKINK